MNFSLVDDFFPGASLEHSLEAISYAGFTHVNIGATLLTKIISSGDTYLAYVRGLLKNNRLAVDWVHAPYEGISLFSHSSQTRALSIAAARTCIDAAGMLDAATLIVHPLNSSYAPNSDWTTTMQNLTEGFAVLLETAQRRHLAVAVENASAPWSHAINRQLLDQLSQLGLCYDAGHAEITKEHEDWPGRHARRLCATHFHDNNGNSDSHGLPGTGTVNFPRAIAQCLSSGYSGVWGWECTYPGDATAVDPKEIASLIFETARNYTETALESVIPVSTFN